MEQNILAAVRSSKPVVGPYEICFIFSQIPYFFFQILFYSILILLDSVMFCCFFLLYFNG